MWKEGQIGKWRERKFAREFNSDDYSPKDRPWWVNGSQNAQINFIKNHNLSTDISATTLDRLMLDARVYGNTYPSQLGSIPSGTDQGPLFFRLLQERDRIGPGSIEGPMKLGQRIKAFLDDLANKLEGQPRLMNAADPGDMYPGPRPAPNLGQPSRRKGWPQNRTYILPDDIQHQIAKRESKAALTDQRGWYSSKIRGREW